MIRQGLPLSTGRASTGDCRPKGAPRVPPIRTHVAARPAVGDVNGDGYSDVAVGACGFGGSIGKAYVYLGGASGPSAAAAWTATGEGTNNYFGWSVSTAGDVNGDGYSDVIVGATALAAEMQGTAGASHVDRARCGTDPGPLRGADVCRRSRVASRAGRPAHERVGAGEHKPRRDRVTDAPVGRAVPPFGEPARRAAARTRSRSRGWLRWGRRR